MAGRPYPGLRPFSREEADRFFGREEQIDQLLDKLAETHFLAVCSGPPAPANPPWSGPACCRPSAM